MPAFFFHLNQQAEHHGGSEFLRACHRIRTSHSLLNHQLMHSRLWWILVKYATWCPDAVCLILSWSILCLIHKASWSCCFPSLWLLMPVLRLCTFQQQILRNCFWLEDDHFLDVSSLNPKKWRVVVALPLGAGSTNSTVPFATVSQLPKYFQGHCDLLI